MKLHIRNRVCNRCIMVVQAELLKLGLHPVAVSPSKVGLTKALGPRIWKAFV